VFPDLNYCASPYEAAEGADAVLIVTEWEEFRQMDWERVRRVVERPLIVDGRNMLEPADVTSYGFHYVSIGRRPMLPVAEESATNEVHPAAGPQTNQTGTPVARLR